MTLNEEVRNALRPMIEEARSSGKWLYHFGMATGEIWMSPNDLEQANVEGRFLWGPVNWKLREPAERLQQIEREIEDLQTQWHEAKEKIEGRG